MRSPRVTVPSTAVLATAMIGYLDYVTGPDIGLSLFYLIPVTACAWIVGAGPSAIVAGAAGVAWLLADASWHGLNSITLWNAATRTAMYGAIALLTARVRADRDALSELNAELGVLLAREQQLARTDSLTGLANARAFFDALQRAIETGRRSGAAFSVAYLDLDEFKAVNDRFGHPTGDRVLTLVAERIAAVVRKADMVARLGGDEFGILFSDADPVQLESACRRIESEIAGVSLNYPDTRLGISIGVVEVAPASADAADAIRRADEAMYRNKHRVVSAAP